MNATLEHLPPIVADMVRLQRLTGCRPEEVCLIRPCDVDTSGAVWAYRPESHKTEHHGRERVIFIGPRGQDVLRPYLLRDKATYCFCTAEGERKRRDLAHEARVTPISYGNRPGTNRKSTPTRPAGERYTTDSYRRAITRACDKAGVGRWAPNRLRHSAATEIRKRFGLEASQVALGHSTANVTQIYAERDLEKAAAVMAQVG
jgi:integrase